MKTILVTLVACSMLAFAGQDMKPLLQNAEALYLQGLQAEKDNDRAKATASWNQAAELYNQCLKQPGFDNARLRFNLGNVYLMQKKLGYAINEYTRALAIEPDNTTIAANLDAARAQRKDKLAAEDKDQVLKTLFAFHYDISLATRRIIFIAAYAILFLAIILRLLTRPHTAFVTVIIIAATVAVAMAVSVSVSQNQANRQHGVIVASAIHAKTGSSNSYQDAFQAPLHDGTEFTVLALDESGKWLHIQLENNADCWLPAASVLLR